jgi:hypothetical protein
VVTNLAALFALLYVGHLLGDYIAQTDRMAGLKVAGATWPEGHPAEGLPVPLLRSWLQNQRHVATYSLMIAATVVLTAALGGFLGALGAVPWWRWVVAVTVNWVAHSVIDRRWPVRRLMEATGSGPFYRSGGAPHVDQTLHLLTLLLVAAFLAR